MHSAIEYLKKSNTIITAHMYRLSERGIHLTRFPLISSIGDLINSKSKEWMPFSHPNGWHCVPNHLSHTPLSSLAFSGLTRLPSLPSLPSLSFVSPNTLNLYYIFRKSIASVIEWGSHRVIESSITCWSHRTTIHSYHTYNTYKAWRHTP